MSKRSLTRSRSTGVIVLAGLVAVASGCSPALDWRQSAPVASGATLLFPCRPEAKERSVRIADIFLPMRMHSCKAGGRWFTLTFVDAPAPSDVAALLAVMRRSAADNLGGSATVEPLPAIAGATPNVQSARLRIPGKLPDGRPVVETALFFVRGLKVYQASVIGEAEAPPDVLEMFFASIRVT